MFLADRESNRRRITFGRLWLIVELAGAACVVP
jgi:hypothetical protein